MIGQSLEPCAFWLSAVRTCIPVDSTQFGAARELLLRRRPLEWMLVLAARASTRRVKGVNLVNLVKILKHHRKQHPFALTPSAEELFAQHMIATQWYPFEPYMELIDVMWRELLGESEYGALKAGIQGGMVALTSYHRAYIVPGDPAESVRRMERSWAAYFDWGELRSEKIDHRTVEFVLTDYPDCPAAHGMMIVGWHVAAGIVAGQEKTRHNVLESPWGTGSHRLVHRVLV